MKTIKLVKDECLKTIAGGLQPTHGCGGVRKVPPPPKHSGCGGVIVLPS